MLHALNTFHSVSVILNIKSLSLSLVVFWNMHMADSVDKNYITASI